ncbi:MAG: D-alanyl-D-alanine carboxypeptidase family protein [Patescibacteria group bacterium]
MFKQIKKSILNIPPLYWIIIGFFVLFLISNILLVLAGKNNLDKINQKLQNLDNQVLSLNGNLASTTAILQQSINQTHLDLSSAIDIEKQNVGKIENLLGTYKEEVGNISGTVNDLEKLTKTDPELLQKYSKVFFLNEHYAPARLTEIPNSYEYNEDKYSKIDSQVWPYLENLLKASIGDGEEIYIYSAYRSFDEQSALKDQYKVVYGSGTANQFSADQGYSEHQLGTTVDLITTGIGGTLDGFGETSAYQWLLKNAYKYGFVLSYPDNNNYYIFEPWHWRFVGVKLATYLYNQGKNFYDLDQRTIDEYLVNLFD